MNIEEKYKETLSSLELEKSEKMKLLSDLENLRVHFSELEATNSHLIAATWRERDLKKKLSEALDELGRTKDIVEKQNTRITESINYARKIQIAINSTEEDIRREFPDSFCLYLPKDVISGDFPWMFELNEFVYIAAVDCTGHGVPGAMMSMIGNLLLNDIVNDGTSLMPSEILTKLHQAVVQTLKQDFSDSNSNDGMDIGLCRINKRSGEICFSGAHRPLFLMRGAEVQVFAGDKFPIGGIHYKGLNKFTDEVIKIEHGDSVFLFTDGLPDQIGGSDRKKLMTRNIKSFIENCASVPMCDLKGKLFQMFDDWKGTNKQIDDVLIIGVRFN
ncbi:MAG: PP2C family protein-serine/threonine phosphatase [Bacteroidia bacterium]